MIGDAEGVRALAEREVVVNAALEAWKALPDDERSGERPYVMGFNAGWEEAIEEAAKIAERTTAFDDNVQKGAGCGTTGQRIAASLRALATLEEKGG